MSVRDIQPTRLVKSILSILLFSIPLLALSAQAMMQAAPAAQSGINGTIVSIEGATLVLAEPNGDSSRVILQSDTPIFGREAATFESIQPGEAMGVTATRGDDGSLTATVINVFTPQIWQNVRKGQWDMGSPGLVMTNAQVDRVANKGEGRTLYMKYDMLTAAIAVPMDAQVRRMVALKLADLKPGMKVSVRLAPGSGADLRAAMISLDLPKS